MSIRERQAAHLDSVVDDGLMEIDSLLQRIRDPRGPGGSLATEEEIENLEAAWRRVRPRIGEAAETLALIRTATTSHHGVRSEWFRRIVTPIARPGRESMT